MRECYDGAAVVTNLGSSQVFSLGFLRRYLQKKPTPEACTLQRLNDGTFYFSRLLKAACSGKVTVVSATRLLVH